MVDKAVPPVQAGNIEAGLNNEALPPLRAASGDAGMTKVPVADTDAKAAMAAFQTTLREVTPNVVIVPTIIAVNIIVFGAMVFVGVHPLNPTIQSIEMWGANYGPSTLGGQPWRLITNVFLHFGIIHLAFNMIALWQAGGIVERIFGELAFSAIYLAAWFAGSLASLAIHPLVLSAGASGAVFGVYGALAAFLVLHRGVIPALVLSKLRWVAFGFIAFNIQNGLLHPNIDNSAHIGGLVAGAIAGALLARPLVPGRVLDRARPIYVTAGSVILAVTALSAIPRPLDYLEVVKRFGSVETPALKLYNDLRLKAQNRELNDNEFASAIEREILPPWKAAHSQLRVQRGWTPAQRSRLELFNQYALARERNWSLIVDALRDKDMSKLEQAKQVQTEIQDLIKHMKDSKTQ